MHVNIINTIVTPKRKTLDIRIYSSTLQKV